MFRRAISWPTPKRRNSQHLKRLACERRYHFLRRRFARLPPLFLRSRHWAKKQELPRITRMITDRKRVFSYFPIKSVLICEIYNWLRRPERQQEMPAFAVNKA